jgi:glycosyltransferase involved in cell wall biosynthesis
MKISVVIPFFNRVDEISDTLASVKGQNYENWECLLIDDGSTVETIEAVRQMIGAEERIQLLSRPQSRTKGANACRNIGIENASGEYVALLDSDDKWNADRLANLVHFLTKNAYPDGVYSGTNIYDGTTIRQRTSRQLGAEENIFDFTLDHGTISQTSSLVVKTTLGRDVLFDEELRRHQDLDFFIRFGLKYKWLFFDNYDITVNWIKGVKRNIDYESCIVFYKKFREDIDASSQGKYYLAWMGEKAVKSSQASSVTNFYRDAIKGIGVNFTLRDKFMYGYPKLFVFIYKLKRALK